MLKEGRIGGFEAVTMISIMITARILFSSPRELVNNLGPSTWFLPIISGGVALVSFYFVFLLMRRFPGFELVAILETVFGRVAGSLIALIICVSFIINSALYVREFVEAVKVYDYPLSPPSFLMVFFLLAVMTMLYLGLETIARTAGFFAWPILTGIIAIFILAVPFYKLGHLFPLLGHGLGKTVISGLTRSSAFGETLALAVVFHSLQSLSYFKKTGFTAIIASGLIVSISFLFYILFFPYYIAAENAIPLFAMTRDIEYGRFFQRFESIFVLTWSISAILAAGINLYIALSIYCKVFRISDHRVLVLPLTIILFTTAILPSDFSSIAYTYVPFFRKFTWLVFFGIPLSALLLAIARGKKGGPVDA